MGIHSRSKSAVLISLLVVLTIGHAQAATRKYVKMPSDSKVGSSTKPSYRSGDKVFVPGDGQTEYIPAKSGTGSRALPVDPTYQYGAFGIAKELGTKLKAGNIAAVGLTIGLSYMLDQIGAFIDEAGNPVKHGQETQPSKSMYWCVQQNPSYCYEEDKFQTPEGYVKSVTDLYTEYEVTSVDVSTTSLYSARASAVTRNVKTGSILNMGPWDLFRHGSCDPGYSYLETLRTCVKQSGTVPLADADYDLMEAAAAAKDSEWLKQRLREHCEGSIAPQKCYDSLRESTSLSGPASISEPGTTSVTTGPAGTTTTTTNTRIDITYGDNYYDYSTTTTKVTTKPDGSTETTTETETPAPVSEEKPADEDIVFDNPEFPPVEPFYIQKYPDGLQGVWDNAKADFEGSEFISFLKSFVPQFSGSCPSWSMSFGISAWANYGTIGFMNLCYIFDFIKVIMLVTALFTARAITFGG